MSKKIFITRQIPDTGIKMLLDKGYEVEVNTRPGPLAKKRLIAALKATPYDGVLSLLTDTIDAEVMSTAPSVKIFANYASGFDNLDLVEAKKRGIAVTNAPAVASSEAVADHTMTLMLSLALRIVEADHFVRDGLYDGWDPMNFIGMDLEGKTLGLIGAGRIGERVAHYAKAFGMNIIYSDVVQNERIERDCGATRAIEVEDVIRGADIVSLHVPLLDSTRHLIDARRLSLMKPTALLINTSRGPVVDEKALEGALKAGTIRGAALDVFEFEPAISRGLRKLPNVILTPHIASASEKARNEMAEIAAANIIDVMEGRVPRNIINP